MRPRSLAWPAGGGVYLTAQRGFLSSGVHLPYVMGQYHCKVLLVTATNLRYVCDLMSGSALLRSGESLSPTPITRGRVTSIHRAAEKRDSRKLSFRYSPFSETDIQNRA